VYPSPAKVGLFCLLAFVTASAFGASPQLIRQYGQGDSMLPTIPYYASYLIDSSPEAFQSIGKGSVVVYRKANGGIVTHRVFKTIVRHGRVEHWTRGDNCLWPDAEYVTAENFLGLVDQATVRPESAEKLATIPWGRRR
jgi:signal peptidase I